MLHPSDTIPLSLDDIIHDPRFARLFLGAVHVLEDLIHFLQRLTGCLGNEKERKTEGEQTEDSEESVGTVASVLDERRCDETLATSVPRHYISKKERTYNDEVVEPVGACRQRDALSTKRRREDLRWHCPRDWTPGSAETEHV